VIPATQIVGNGPIERFRAWLLTVSGQSPGNLVELLSSRLLLPLSGVGLQPELRQLSLGSSTVFVVVAVK
jgi:hypothetical protein